MPLSRLAPTPDPVLVQDTSLAIDGLPPERLQHLGGGHRASWHWGLGTTYHEAGTLWMGASAADSVTTGLGRFHHVQNVHACDQSLFPTVGSVNPVLTGTTLARRLARQLP